MSFSVFINSDYAVVNDSSVSTSIRDYDVDWSRFEEGDYEMTFSFESVFKQTNVASLSIVPYALSLPDLPLKNVVSPLGGRSRNSPSVGLIHTNLMGANGLAKQAFAPPADDIAWQQYSSNPNNKPVICNRPSSQNFRVRFLGFGGDEFFTIFVPYTLMLYFKKL